MSVAENRKRLGQEADKLQDEDLLQLLDKVANVYETVSDLRHTYGEIVEDVYDEISFIKLALVEAGMKKELDVCGYITSEDGYDCDEELEKQFGFYTDD